MLLWCIGLSVHCFCAFLRRQEGALTHVKQFVQNTANQHFFIDMLAVLFYIIIVGR